MNDESKKHPHAELIKAWADGAEVQCRVDGEWIDSPTPNWLRHLEYRIKPEEPTNEPWKPKKGKYYYYVNMINGDEVEIDRDQWCDGAIEDMDRYELGNCFRTRAAAEAAAERVKAALKGEVISMQEETNLLTEVALWKTENNKLRKELEAIKSGKDNNAPTIDGKEAKELEWLRKNFTKLEAEKNQLIAHPVIDDKPLSEGEIALIKALRSGIYEIFKFGKTRLILIENNGELVSCAHHIAFSVKSSPEVIAALEQIKAEQEAAVR